MLSITDKLAQMANGKVLIALVLVSLPFTVLFEWRKRYLRTFSHMERTTLDFSSYTAKDAYELFSKLQERGRQVYAWTEITVDMIYPIIYACFLSLLTIYIFQKCSMNKSLHLLALLPFIVMLFDYCENSLIAFMLFAYPREHLTLASIASSFTKLKLSLLVVCGVAVIFGLICLVIKLVRS